MIFSTTPYVLRTYRDFYASSRKITLVRFFPDFGHAKNWSGESETLYL